MALKKSSELSTAQWLVIHYSRLSNLGLSAAIAVPILAYIFGPVESAPRFVGVTIVTIISVTAWFFFDRWCQDQIHCAVCRKSLFRRWVLEVWVGFWRWFGGIPDRCPHCGARLP